MKSVDDDQAWRARVFASLGSFAAALKELSPVVNNDTTPPEILAVAAGASWSLGRADHAWSLYERAFALRPTERIATDLAQILVCAPSATEQDIALARRRYGAILRAGGTGEEVGGGTHDPMSPVTAAPEHTAQTGRNTSSRPTVAYLSAHWHQAHYLPPVWGVINKHDRDRIKIVLLDDSPTPSPPTQLADGDIHVAIHGIDDTALQQVVDDLGVDIIVDLSAYSAVSRHRWLAGDQRSQRVIGWFNHFAPSGLAGVGELVGDMQCGPVDPDAYRERVHLLADSYLRMQMPEAHHPPLGPQAGHPPVFGSFASAYKLTPPVLDAWATILERNPGSQMVLANADLSRADNVAFFVSAFEERGIDPSRITTFGRAPHDAFVERYALVDIALDPWPYSGGTTTSEALWHGARVVTLKGDRWAARTSASLLHAADMADDVVDHVDRYVARATELACGVDDLRTSRGDVRERLRCSRIFDVTGLAGALEEIYVGERPS